MNPIQNAIAKISGIARQKFGDNQGFVQNNRLTMQPVRQAISTPADLMYTATKLSPYRATLGNMTRDQYKQALDRPLQRLGENLVGGTTDLAYTMTKMSPYHAALGNVTRDQYKQILNRPVKKFAEGFVEGTTVGLTDINVAPSRNLVEKLAYGGGYVASVLNPYNPMNKVAGVIGGTQTMRAAQLTLGKTAAKAIAQKGLAKLAGLAIKGVSQGLPYTTAYGALNLATKSPQEAGESIRQDVGVDAVIGALPLIGGTMLGLKPLVKKGADKIDKLKIYDTDVEEMAKIGRSMTNNFKNPDGSANLELYDQSMKALDTYNKDKGIANKAEWNKMDITKKFKTVTDFIMDKASAKEIEVLKPNVTKRTKLDPQGNVIAPGAAMQSVEDPILSEARKYNTPEEFVRAQGTPVYHGTNYANARQIQQTGLNPESATSIKGDKKFVFLTGNEQYAKSYATQKGGDNSFVLSVKKPADTIIEESTYRKGMKFPDLVSQKTIPPEDIIIKGKDGKWYPIKEFNFFTGEADTYIGKTPVEIKTKSQLEEIWKKANNVGGIKRSPPVEVSGGVAGIEQYQDEQGNTQYRFNPIKGAAGIVGVKLAKDGKIRAFTQPEVKKLSAQELKEQLQVAQNNAQQAMRQKEYVDSVWGSFSPETRKAIGKIRTQLNNLEAKGADMTNVTLSKTYKKSFDDVMATLGTNSEDEALDFIKNMPDRKVKGVAQEIQIANQLTKQIETQERKLAKQAVKEWDEWSRQVINEKIRQERETTKQALGTITNTIKQQPSALTRDMADYKDISGFSAGMRDLYRNFKTVYGKHYNKAKQILLDPFDRSKGAMVDEQNRLADELDSYIVKKLGIKPGSDMSASVQEFGEKQIDKLELIKRFGTDKANKIVEADKWFRKKYDSMLDELNETRKQIYPNDPTKIIPKRSDYYRHYRELGDGFEGLKNIFDTPAGISSALSGVSEYAKPKSKWLSLAQRRLGVKTEVDAIGGFVDYIKASTYAKHIDPHISKFRMLAADIATQTAQGKYENKLNIFKEFLEDFANDLSGKTNPLDRAFQKWLPFDRKLFRVINWANSRVKANVILGNASSSLAQFAGIPVGMAEVGNPKYWAQGAGEAIASIFRKTALSESNFIKERYSNAFDRFDTGILKNAKKFAVWMVQVGDEIGTKYIWSMNYKKALAEGIDDAVSYADNATRAVVAGRGVGEVPLAQKAKLFQMVAPFQLEVANLWWVMKDMVDQKTFGKIATLFIANHLFNKAATEIRGTPVTFDPIQAGMDALAAYEEEDDKTRGLMRAGGRVAGELLSNAPLGQTFASVYPEYGYKIKDKQLPTRKQLFGKSDPTRFGGGALFTKGIQDPLYKLLPPFGGAQIQRMIEGKKVLDRGYSETSTGRVRYLAPEDPINKAKNVIFGQYSTPQAREYFDKSRTALGENQSEKVARLQGEARKAEYSKIHATRDTDRVTKKENSVISQPIKEKVKALDVDDKIKEGYIEYATKLEKYKQTKDPKTGSSLYYSIKNTKRLTPEMKDELLRDLPVPENKSKTKQLTTQAKTASKTKKTRVKRAKKVKTKKIKMPKLSSKLPKAKKIKATKVKTTKIKSMKPPKLAKVKARTRSSLTQA